MGSSPRTAEKLPGGGRHAPSGGCSAADPADGSSVEKGDSPCALRRTSGTSSTGVHDPPGPSCGTRLRGRRPRPCLFWRPRGSGPGCAAPGNRCGGSRPHSADTYPSHELDLRSEFLSNEGEKFLEGCDGAFPADPQQADDALVDLVDQRQVFVTFGVLDFIHTDGADRFQRAMLQAPTDHILDGEAHLFPGSVERLGGFLPGELARPTGQEQHVGLGKLVLAIAPRNLFHYHHATMAALDAPHAVQEKDQKPPDGDEFEAPFGKMIVTRRRLVAPRADRRRSGPRPDVHFDAFLVGAEAGVIVDESPMVVAEV